MTDKDDLSGRKLGEFVVREQIGEGGFGTVYACEQPLLGREAVVKVLHRKRHRRDVIVVQRFLREARLASRLDHPYAAHIYAFGIEHDRLLWIAMERVQGVTLAQWLTAHGPMPLGQLVAFFEHIASVVQTAHERGIVHRDLKPSNVMVIERAGEMLPKLLDFGVAKLLDGAVLPEVMPEITYLPLPATEALSEKSPANMVRAPGKSTVTDPAAALPDDPVGLTQDHYTVGSPPYMSPEQWGNAVTVGPAADLYALAVVAFEALTGRHLFQATTMAEYAELHCRGIVPALGGSFSPALDRMFQRALAKRPEDRWGTALELAGALRAASGIGATRSDLPRIDHDVRDAWLAGAPQPLAESMAELDDAHNAHQARDIAEELIRTLVRYLLAMTLALNARAHEDRADPALLELVRALDRRTLGMDERVRLLRLLARRLTGPRPAHPVPELLALLTPNPGGTDGFDPVLALYAATDHAVTEEAVRLQLLRLIPVLTQLLRKATFVLDYVLVVPRDHTAERWTGRRRQSRALANVVDGELVDGHPMLLDRAGRICVDLWPLVQAAPPSDGAETELFLFDGHGHHGALLIAAPSGLEHHDSIVRDWVATHVIAEIEAKTRMREQIRVAAHHWQDRGRPEGLLWRGDALADFERWTRHTTGAAPLGDLDASFVAASRRVARRARWIRRLLIAAVAATAVGIVEYRAALKTRMAEQIATEAEVEQGRQALLHDEPAEAQLHLSEAYRRGDHSQSTQFMLSRALQPLRAEQARFAAAAGHMWSAAFSPDGRQIVTTDDACARIWDARTSRLMFTLPHGDTVYDARYSADGARLVTASGDGAVRIWDASTGALVHTLKQARADGKPARFFALALSPDGRLVAAIDTAGAVAHVWDAVSGAPLAELRNDASDFPSIAFSADSRWLATSGGDDARVFDTRTWVQALTLAGPRIRALSFDPTAARLVTGSAGGDATIWEIPSGARARHLREVGASVRAVAFSTDGQFVATGGSDGAAQIWDARSGALRNQITAARTKIRSIEFDPTSKLVVAAGEGDAVVVAETLGMPIAVLDVPRGVVRTAHFDPTSHHVVGASWEGTAQVWDATSPYRRWSSPPVAADCGLVASLEPDGRFLAIGCRDHATRIWDTSRDQLVAELPSVTPVARDFTSAFPAVSTAGDRAAIARGDTVEVYELPSRRLVRVIRHGAAVNAVAFAPAGHDLVSGATDGSLLVTRDGREPIALPTSVGGIDAAGFLVDGRVVAGDARGRLRIYDPDRAAVIADLELPTRLRLLRPSPDGLRLVTISSYTGKAVPPLLWDLERYRLVAPLEGHVGQAFSARYVDGEHAIVTVGADGAARLWNGETGRLLSAYRSSSRFLADVVVSSDGSMVIAGGSDGLLWFWDRATARPLWTLQAHSSHVVGIRFEGDEMVTRGFAGDVSRWTLPKPAQVIEATLSNR
jgi:WD40 repeat protein/serine/threonine protein kinase